MTVHVKGSVSVVTHKLIELNETFTDAILKALSTVMNEKRSNSVFTVKTIKRPRVQYKHFSFNNYIHVSFISTFPTSLMSCNLNVVYRCQNNTLV